MSKLLLLVFLFFVQQLMPQEPNDDIHPMPEYLSSSYRQKIHIPDIGNYKVLKCDLHTHTVFSDGNVWPVSRVDEAWREGLDAVAITDHIEYRPRKEVITDDLNLSYTIAKNRADEIGFLLIKGAEITRNKPIGHMNALFINDVNLLNTKHAEDAVEEAYKQNAIVMLNHPGWPDNKSTIDTMHIRLMKENKIQLIEVFNTSSFYPKVVGWMNDFDLGPVASTDIHDLSANTYTQEKCFRPMTLVLASAYSLEGIKQALFAKRCIAFFNQHIAGKKEYVKALFEACISARIVSENEVKKRYNIEITNDSDILFELKSQNGSRMQLRPNTSYRMFVSYSNVNREYAVINAYIGLNEYLRVTLPLIMDQK